MKNRPESKLEIELISRIENIIESRRNSSTHAEKLS